MIAIPGTRFVILVTGSREWADAGTIREALLWACDRYEPSGPVVVRHGAQGTPAKGADAQAGYVASALGMEIDPCPADWQAECRDSCQPGHRRVNRHGGQYCPAAGNHRNQLMVDKEPKPDVCLAFPLPGSRGTWDCVRRAKAAGIAVYHAVTREEL